MIWPFLKKSDRGAAEHTTNTADQDSLTSPSIILGLGATASDNNSQALTPASDGQLDMLFPFLFKNLTIVHLW